MNIRLDGPMLGHQILVDRAEGQLACGHAFQQRADFAWASH
jgi:hypothetical protein